MIARHEAELDAPAGCTWRQRAARQPVRVPHRYEPALRQAQLILTVTSAIHAVIEPEHLQPGSVVCDVARPPRDVSAAGGRGARGCVGD